MTEPVDKPHTDIYELIKPGIERVPSVTLRNVSWNIRYAAGGDEKDESFLDTVPKDVMYKNLDQIVKVLKDNSPGLDQHGKPVPYVVNLQEVDFGSSRTHNVDQAQYIAETLGMYVAKAPNLVFNEDSFLWRLGRKYVYSNKDRWNALINMLSTYPVALPPGPIQLSFGLATLSNYPISHERNIPFTKRNPIPLFDNIQLFRLKDERKSYHECMIDYAPDVHKKIPYYSRNTHLDTRNADLRKQEARKIIRAAEHWQNTHYTFSGDMNSEPIGSAYPLGGPEADAAELMIVRKDLFQCYSGLYPDNYEDNDQGERVHPSQFWTFSSRHPRKTFDMILASPLVQFQSYRVIRSQVSDHRPVVADILLPSDVVKKSRLDVLEEILDERTDSKLPLMKLLDKFLKKRKFW